ncbi:thioredoxin-disulfide reductase [Draconibacterium sp.]
MDEIFDVIIIGAGAAGLTAGIYTSRAKLSTLILNEGAVGGQMVLTDEIANYPGVELIKGYELASIMKSQAKNFGCKIKSNIKISKYNFEGEVKEIELSDGRSFKGKTIILTPGGRPRSLNLEGEDRFKGKGISYCATCDGDFFTGKEVVVVGGGNSALEEAVALTRFATKVTIVHQFGQFQAFEHAILEATKNPKIKFLMESELRGFYGNGQLNKVTIEHLPSRKMRELKTDGTFIFIGYQPNTESIDGLCAIERQQRNCG